MILRTFSQREREREGIKATNFNDKFEFGDKKDKNIDKYIEFVAGYRSSWSTITRGINNKKIKKQTTNNKPLHTRKGLCGWMDI